jgi:mRNA interferase RelE/StbE
MSQPRPPGCKKLSGSQNEWRVRVGDYRILYEIDDRIRRVRIYAIGHRREIYR